MSKRQKKSITEKKYEKIYSACQVEHTVRAVHCVPLLSTSQVDAAAAKTNCAAIFKLRALALTRSLSLNFSRVESFLRRL